MSGHNVWFYRDSDLILYKFRAKDDQFSVPSFIHYVLKHSLPGLFVLIISEWQLESVVVMATMQCDVWRRTADTRSHML